MSYFHDATIEHQNVIYTLTAQECTAEEGGSAYWHSAGEPSSWLAVQMFYLARRKAENAPQSVALALAAQALGISVDTLVTSLRWQERYMQFHDNDYSYRILDDDADTDGEQTSAQ